MSDLCASASGLRILSVRTVLQTELSVRRGGCGRQNFNLAPPPPPILPPTPTPASTPCTIPPLECGCDEGAPVVIPRMWQKGRDRAEVTRKWGLSPKIASN